MARMRCRDVASATEAACSSSSFTAQPTPHSAVPSSSPPDRPASSSAAALPPSSFVGVRRLGNPGETPAARLAPNCAAASASSSSDPSAPAPADERATGKNVVCGPPTGGKSSGGPSLPCVPSPGEARGAAHSSTRSYDSKPGRSVTTGEPPLVLAGEDSTSCVKTRSYPRSSSSSHPSCEAGASDSPSVASGSGSSASPAAPAPATSRSNLERLAGVRPTVDTSARRAAAAECRPLAARNSSTSCSEVSADSSLVVMPRLPSARPPGFLVGSFRPGPQRPPRSARLSRLRLGRERSL
eukprot:scaffold4107_cov95-Isochrysis_galbana.AAC.12